MSKAALLSQSGFDHSYSHLIRNTVLCFGNQFFYHFTQFLDFFILRFYLLLQCFDIRTFSLYDFRSTLSHFEGNTGIDHIFTRTEAACHVQHDIFIRAIESADSHCIFTAVIAYTGSDTPFLRCIVIKRMQGCQSRRIRPHLIDTAIQTLNTSCILLNTSCILVDRRFHISDLTDTQGLSGNSAHILHIISMCIIGAVFVIGRQNLGGPTIRIIFVLNGEGPIIPLQ